MGNAGGGDFGGSTVAYDDNYSTQLLLVDNATAGVYDTLVLRSFDASIPAWRPYRVFNVTRDLNKTINATSSSLGKVYLQEIRDCFNFAVVSPNSAFTTQQGGSGGEARHVQKTFLGDHATNESFTIPYVIRRGNENMSSMNISVLNIAVNDIGSAWSGARLATTAFTYNHSLSDVEGMAFLTLNITQSGNYELFWALNKSGSSDLAHANWDSSGPFNVRTYRLETRGVNDQRVQLSGASNSSNVTVCAQNFARNTVVVNFTAFLRRFNNGQSTLTALNMYNASTGVNLTLSGFTQSAVNNSVQGEDGASCVRFYVGPTGTWPTCSSGEILIRGTNSTYGTEEMRAPGQYEFSCN